MASLCTAAIRTCHVLLGDGGRMSQAASPAGCRRTRSRKRCAGRSGVRKRQVDGPKSALLVCHEREGEVAGAGAPLRARSENDQTSGT